MRPCRPARSPSRCSTPPGSPGSPARPPTASPPLGFAISGAPANAPVSGQADSEVRYPASLEKQAKTLAAAVPGSKLVPDETVTTVTLYVGSDFGAARPQRPRRIGQRLGHGPPSAPASTVPKTADQITCVN